MAVNPLKLDLNRAREVKSNIGDVKKSVGRYRLRDDDVFGRCCVAEIGL